MALAGSLQGDNESPRKRSVEGNNRRNVNDGWVLGGGGDDDGGDDSDGDGDNDGGDDDKEEEMETVMEWWGREESLTPVKRFTMVQDLCPGRFTQ